MNTNLTKNAEGHKEEGVVVSTHINKRGAKSDHAVEEERA
jgi:hypothetical protein